MGTQKGHGSWLGEPVLADSGDIAQRQVVRAVNSAGNDIGGGGGPAYGVVTGSPLGTPAAGTQQQLLLDGRGNLRATAVGTLTNPAGALGSNVVSFVRDATDGIGYPLQVLAGVWDGANVYSAKGTSAGTSTHAPQSAPTDLSTTIAASGGTATIVFLNTAQTEVINSGTATLWARWGAAAAVNTAGSFPIAPGGTFSKDRVGGTLNLLSTAANSPVTATRYS